MTHEDLLWELLRRQAYPVGAFHIDQVLGDRRIFVYGAGEAFHYFKEVVMRTHGYKPVAVLDRRFGDGDTFEGVSACSPLGYHVTADEARESLVVVCLGDQGQFQGVVALLQERGFVNIISLRDIYEVHNPFDLPAELAAEGFGYYAKRRDLIMAGLELMADEHSREVYCRFMQTHLERRPVVLPMCARHEQYTPKGIVLAKGYGRFVYCGVSVGEMSRVLRDVGPVDELVCFEPHPEQFRLASELLMARGEQSPRRAVLFPCAVYSRDAVERFTFSETSFGSRILAAGTAHVQCVSIDHVLPGFRPTFINMDVEGAELEALRGAERTIRESRPDLGICVYHAPNHVWDVPSYLHGLGLGYRFYLRNYTSFTSETVLYATAA